MPELPDVTVYVEALRERVIGHKLIRALVRGSVSAALGRPAAEPRQGRTVHEVRRLGKQIAIGIEGGSVAGAASEDRGTAALADCRPQNGR